MILRMQCDSENLYYCELFNIRASVLLSEFLFLIVVVNPIICETNSPSRIFSALMNLGFLSDILKAVQSVDFVVTCIG